MPVFVINLAIYLIFLAFLTAYAIFIPLPTESSCRIEEECSIGKLINIYIHTYSHAYIQQAYLQTISAGHINNPDK